MTLIIGCAFSIMSGALLVHSFMRKDIGLGMLAVSCFMLGWYWNSLYFAG